MRVLHGLIGLSFSVLFCSSAIAQDEAKSDPVIQAESGQVDCETFKITPPKDWRRVVGALSDGELAKLPENIREHYSRPTSDVIFLDSKSPDEVDTKTFKNSLNIVSIGEKIPLTDELVKELTNVLKSQYAAMFENFELDSSEKSQINGIDVLVVKGHYGLLNYSVKMEQVLYPTDDNAFVLTCSYDANAAHVDEVIESCRKAIKSIEFPK